MPKSFLIIAHAPSQNTHKLAESALHGAQHPDVGDVRVQLMSPFDIVTKDIFDCDALLIGTTENIGYMAGATKDMFDRCYNDWLGQTEGLPAAFYIRAGLDGTATRRALESIVSALHWRMVADPLILHGVWQQHYAAEVEGLAMGMAAGLDAGIF